MQDHDPPVLPSQGVIFERLQAAEARIGWLNSQSEQHMARIMTLERQLRLRDVPQPPRDVPLAKMDIDVKELWRLRNTIVAAFHLIDSIVSASGLHLPP